MKNLEHLQEIARLILEIPAYGKGIGWRRTPKICAKIAQLILRYDLDPLEINSYCIVNGLRVSSCLFYNIARGYLPTGNDKYKKWDQLILEMYNLNIEPDENFRRYNPRLKNKKSHFNTEQSKPIFEIAKPQFKEFTVKFEIGTSVYNIVHSKIVNQLT